MSHDSGAPPMTAADRAVLRDVLRWARAAGAHRAFGGPPRLWTSRDRSVAVLQIGAGVAVRRNGMPLCLLGVSTVTETVSMLADLGVIPARFSTCGARALTAHAEACERYARHLLHRGPGDAVLTAWATAWLDAAAAARTGAA